MPYVMMKPSKPCKPYKPVPPKEYHEQHISILRLIRDVKKTISLDELRQLLPAHVTLEDLRFTYREHDNGCEAYSDLDIYYVKREVNDLYDRQLYSYELDLKLYEVILQQYKKALVKYKKNLKKYIEWYRKLDRSKYHKVYISILEKELEET